VFLLISNELRLTSDKSRGVQRHPGDEKMRHRWHRNPKGGGQNKKIMGANLPVKVCWVYMSKIL